MRMDGVNLRHRAWLETSKKYSNIDKGAWNLGFNQGWYAYQKKLSMQGEEELEELPDELPAEGEWGDLLKWLHGHRPQGKIGMALTSVTIGEGTCEWSWAASWLPPENVHGGRTPEEALQGLENELVEERNARKNS